MSDLVIYSLQIQRIEQVKGTFNRTGLFSFDLLLSRNWGRMEKRRIQRIALFQFHLETAPFSPVMPSSHKENLDLKHYLTTAMARLDKNNRGTFYKLEVK